MAVKDIVMPELHH